MAKYIDQDTCIQCGTCVAECPNEGIKEEDGGYVIDSELCTECYGFYEESHCAESCPVDAIGPDPDHQEDPAELTSKAARLHPERFPRD